MASVGKKKNIYLGTCTACTSMVPLKRARLNIANRNSQNIQDVAPKSVKLSETALAVGRPARHSRHAVWMDGWMNGDR
jgi:hypothetical protein